MSDDEPHRPKPDRPKANRKKARIGRRDLLRGRLWRLARGGRTLPLIRYPKSKADVVDTQDDTGIDDSLAEPISRDSTSRASSHDRKPTKPPRSIAGIVIEPVAPTSLGKPERVASVPLFRPPGAIGEPSFLAGCTRCNDCAKACPHQAIHPAHERLGAAAGTPVIDADVQACQMCEDFPCIAACPEGVLRFKLPKQIGTARITEHLCLAHQGQACTVCADDCPVPQAIVTTDRVPRVAEDTCTGCGVCRYVCPAPENAILLMPTFQRPD